MERIRFENIIDPIKKHKDTIGIVTAGILGIAWATFSACGDNKSDTSQSSVSPQESIRRSLDRSQAGPDVFVNAITSPNVGDAGLISR